MTDAGIDDALDSVAFVRLASQDMALSHNLESFNVLLADRNPEQIKKLLWSVAGLAALTLHSWHTSFLEIVPEEEHYQIPTPDDLLDSLVQMVAGGIPPEEP